MLETLGRSVFRVWERVKLKFVLSYHRERDLRGRHRPVAAQLSLIGQLHLGEGCL